MMYIGGDFTTVNGNATPQPAITQINCGAGIGSFYEQPMENAASNIYGINGYVNTIKDVGSSLYVGGLFGTVNNTGQPLYNIAKFDNMTSPGSLTIDNFGETLATNGEVNSIEYYAPYVFVGGDFTGVQYSGGGGPLSFIQYFAIFETGSNTWFSASPGGSTFSGRVYSMGISTMSNPANAEPQVLVLGNFSSPWNTSTYISATNPFGASPLSTNLPPVSFSNRNLLSCGNGYDYVLSDTRTAYRSNSFTNWTDLGDTSGGSQPGTAVSGILSNGPYVSYSDSGIIRVLGSVSQIAAFVLPSANFRYNGSEYQTATLNTKYTAQQFVADSAGTYFYPVGQPTCTFS